MGNLAKYNLAFDVPKEYENATAVKIQEMVGNHYILDSFKLYESNAEKNKENPEGVSLFFTDTAGQKFRCSTHAAAIISTCKNILASGDDVHGVEFTVITRRTQKGNTVYLLD